MAVAAFAPAKVNLYLHLIGRRADGYHLLDSLVAFADIGDALSVRPAEALTLEIDGPEGAALAEGRDDNLVLRAARLLARRVGMAAPGAAFRLVKNLPVAAGIGGGSSDAAATLRALCGLWRPAIDKAGLAGLAAQLGADVPVCFYGRPARVGGIGEAIEPVGDLPPCGIVLANPRRPLPTVAVFAARQGLFGPPAPRLCEMPRDAAGLAAFLARCRNDLTGAAIGLAPEIATVLEALERLPGALVARMSGSGATCFALFPDRAAAVRAAAALAATRPRWWCAAGALLAESGLSR